MTSESSKGRYTIEDMPYVLKICPVCGKEFKCYSCDDWAYYRRIFKDGQYVKELLCSYHCMPSTGIINMNKYDDASLRKQEKATYERHKEVYKKNAAERQKAHRKELNAKNWLRYNAGTPEAESARLERNRKAREKKQLQAMQKWQVGKGM